MKKVLLITYYWPPGSGAGVQRWLKFSKYLPSMGWEPVILTVEPGNATFPASDYSLVNEVPRDLAVHKTRATDYFRFYKKDKTKIPSAGFANNDNNGLREKVLRFARGNLFIPDPRKGWNKYALAKACEIIGNEKISHVITTSPPHSTQLIGLKLKKKYPTIKWIADLRDPWTDIYYYKQFYPNFISKMIDSHYEREVLTSADRIITVGKSLKDLFSSKLSGTGKKIEVITNGYDEDDFIGLTAANPEICTISYIGTISDAYPVDGFLEALCSNKDKGNEFRLRFVGTVSSKQKELILAKMGKTTVEFIPYVDHATAIRYMVDATVLLLIIPDHRSNKSIITGKLFEYIASEKPIICLGPPDGDAAEIILQTGNGFTFKYDDVPGISDFITDLVNNRFVTNNKSASGFSRQILTSKVASVLNNIS